MAGTLSTAVIGYLAMKYNAQINPAVYGKILCVVQFIAFAGSVPFYWLAGKAYVKMKQGQQKIIDEKNNLPNHA